MEHIRQRSKIIKKIRQFFELRGVLEVETPLLSPSTATDPHIQSFQTNLMLSSTMDQRYFLQTSPEFAMKRLLAAGSGSIFQICKAFRNGEIGKKHNPEFTLLEWYRVGFTHHDLMDEMDEFLQDILEAPASQRLTYRKLFEEYFSINPHTCSVSSLQEIALSYNLILDNSASYDKDTWLDLLLTHMIEPDLGLTAPLFIYDYPQTQAALAKIRQEDEYKVGERFEVYYKGLELANGYHELNDSQEQLQRFKADNEVREKLGRCIIPHDKYLLEALTFLPNCAGVALGIDRLICLALKQESLKEVITFPITVA